MKKLILPFLFLLLLIQPSWAQNPNLKWGKPSQMEWDLQAWGEAPDAEAVILCKLMTVTYEIHRQFNSYSGTSVELDISSIEHLGSTDFQNVTVTYDFKLRTKILKESGTGYADIDIVYYNEEADNKAFDEIENLKVIAYSLNEKGKVERHAVKVDRRTDTRLDANYMVSHIRVPDVKKGDIIEYQYQITSCRFNYIYDCSFQEDIPVLYCKCDMNIPALLQFDMKVPVYPFIKSQVKPDAISGPQRSDMKAPDRYPCNHYVIEGHDILPKGLDLQRQSPDVEAAGVKTGQGKLMNTKARFKLPDAQPAAMPDGYRAIILNAK